jgi:N-acetylneuraminic acid mutarotase
MPRLRRAPGLDRNVSRSTVVAAAVAVFSLGGSCGSSGGGSSIPEDPQSTAWRPVAAFGGPAVSFSAAFTIGERAYVGTGYGAGTAFFQYDPAADAWTGKAPFPDPARGAAVAFAIGARGYAGTGYGTTSERYADLWEYDPGTDRWTQRASLPGRVRDHASAFVIGQRAYVVGGMTCQGEDCSSLREVWEYEPAADRWTRKADFPEEITTAATFVLNGIGYLGTGHAGPLASSSVSTSLWAYDPQADTWTRRADLPAAGRYRAVGFPLDGKGYLGTGIQSAAPGRAVVLRDMWEYDPATNAWTRRSDFSGPARGAAVSFVLGRRVFVGTGSGSAMESLRDFWRLEAAAR